jgi:glycosyltransferase involved in cell wall biosynthesis
MPDICFIVAPQNKDGILDRIAKEIAKSFNEPIIHYSTDNVPKADRYFITHYSMLPKVMEQVNPGITPVICFFTHDKGNVKEYADIFNLCHAVIAESPEGEELLRSIGVMDNLLHFVPEGGDNEVFKPHQRQDDGAILVCGTNYADGRKNPELVKDVLKLVKHPAIILGKDWNNHIHLTPEYKDYPEWFNQCSVYLSCSKLEGGGPNSLIEAMHANLIPVVSDTGNARQYIKHGYNGFIFPVNTHAEYVASLIERAYRFKPQDEYPFNDVWKTVGHFTWQSYSIQMKEIITGDYSKTTSQGEYAFKPE